MAIKTVRGLEAMTRQEQRELHLLSLKNKRLRDLIAVCKYPVGRHRRDGVGCFSEVQ